MPRHLFVLIALSVGFTASSLCAGSLTPPGAPSSTMKSLDEIEPRTAIYAADLPMIITSPGSYYLAEDVSFTVLNQDCITISTSSVSIDLNGFTITGPGKTAGFTGSGIRETPQSSNIRVTNGGVRNFRALGISFGGGNSHYCENVNARDNGNTGISIKGGIIRDCDSSHNGANGIRLGSGFFESGIVENCNVHNNEAYGIEANHQVIVRGNNSFSNIAGGIRVFGSESRIEDNNVVDNTGPGIVTENSCLVIKNSARNNTANYVFDSSTANGPVVNVSAGGPIATTNPWANFSY